MAGFAIEQKVLAETDCNALLSALSATSVRRSRAGARHLMGNPAVAELAADGELIAIAKAWLGKAAVPFRATLFEKSSQTNWLIPWHQDTALPLTAQSDSPGWGAWSKKEGILYAHAPAWALERVVALRVHLDPSEADNGPLRVLPGSHTAGVLTDREVLDRVAAGNPNRLHGVPRRRAGNAPVADPLFFQGAQHGGSAGFAHRVRRRTGFESTSA